jgi:hypothetical protein
VAILRAHSRHQAPSPLAGSDAEALYGDSRSYIWTALTGWIPNDRISGVRPFRRRWRNPHAFILAASRRISRITSVERNLKKMKTFIVYDLDSQMPVAVGEQVSPETARYCASVATGILEANLLAEEIDLEKQITY